MILHRQINAWTTGIELSSGYRSDGLWSAKTVSTAADRYAVVSPDFCSLDVGGQTHRWDTPTTLDLSADASWDFGQSIGTWQAGHEYSVGDWVRPTSIADGRNNPRTTFVSYPMSGNSSPSIQATTSSSVYDARYPAYSAFTQTNTGESDCWLKSGSDSTPWLKIDIGVAKCVNKYAIQARNWSTGDFPVGGWTLSGSNDDSNWVTLDTQNSMSSPGQNNWSSYFTFINSVSYRYYKLSINSPGGGVGELKLVQASNLVYRCTTAGTSHSSEPSWGTTVSGTTTETGGVVWTAYYDDTKAINRAGQDYYIYACQTATTAPKLIVSRNSTYPHGYTASNSRKIGGFHCLCNSVGTISGHDLTGYLTGDILPRSVWCLDHRSDSGSNVGFVFDPKLLKWVGIYLVSGTKTAPTNVYGGTILDTITYYEACDAATLMNMRLPGDAEFQTFAAGSPEAVNIYGSADTVTVGGYISTGSVRMISNIGCEGCTGQMYQWLDETSYRFDAAASHTHSVTLSGEAQTATSGNASGDVAPAWSWKNNTGGKGQLYTQGTYGAVKCVSGGDYDDGSYSGTRSRSLNNHTWNTGANIGIRFITGHTSRSV